MADGDANLILKGFDSYEVSLGDALRGERATLGKSLLDVERDLKIRAAYISAIEECDISAFPNTGFVAGYVRSYARYLNLDPDPTFEAFCREANFKGTDVTNFQTSPKTKQLGGKSNKNKNAQVLSVNESWEPGSVGVVTAQGFNTASIFHSFGPFVVLMILLVSLSYGGWKIFENIQRIDLVAIEQSPIVQSLPNSSNLTSQGILSEDASGLNPDIMALYSDQISQSSLSNPREGRIADIDGNKVGFYAKQSEITESVEGLSSDLSGVQNSNLPILGKIGSKSDQLLNYNKTVREERRTEDENFNLVKYPLPEIIHRLPAYYLFSFGPAWIKLASLNNEETYEIIIDSESPFFIEDKWHFGLIRAGNANNLYLVIDDAAFGPMGKGSVVKNVEISDVNFLTDLRYDEKVTKIFNSLQNRKLASSDQ